MATKRKQATSAVLPAKQSGGAQAGRGPFGLAAVVAVLLAVAACVLPPPGPDVPAANHLPTPLAKHAPTEAQARSPALRHEVLKQVRPRDPASAEQAYLKARELLQHGQKAKALPFLQEAVDHDVNFVDARYWLANAKLLTGAQDFVFIALLLEGVGESPNLVDAQRIDAVLLLGQVYDKLALLKKAARQYKNALKLGEELAKQGQDVSHRLGVASYALARGLLQRGLAKEAQEVASKAMRSSPSVWQNLDVFAMATASGGRVDNALRIYQAAQKRLTDLRPAERDTATAAFGSSLAWLVANQTPTAPGLEVSSSRSAATWGSGGWGHGELLDEDISCEGLDRVDAKDLTQERLMRDYVDRNKPLLISGAFEHWPAVQSLRRDRLLKDRGDVPVLVRRSSLVTGDNEFGGLVSYRQLPLKEYISNMRSDLNETDAEDPFFVFQESALPGARGKDWDATLPLFDDPARLARLGPNGDAAQLNQLSLGPAGAGATFHQHSNSYAALLHGRRRWFLFAPYEQFGPFGVPMLKWAREQRSKWLGRGIQCTQLSGELLYVPTNWWHGVLNLEESISVVQELGYNRKLIDAVLSKEASRKPG